MAKVTLFGLPGTGTTSSGKWVADRIESGYKSGGSFYRQMALDMDLSLNDFEKLCNTDPKYDLRLDDMQKKFGEENDNFLVESRLGWFFIPDSIKIKLTCDDDVRVKRIAKRDGITIEDAESLTQEREGITETKYSREYGIKEFAPDSVFDLIIDTTKKPLTDVVDEIVLFLKSRGVVS